MLITRTEKHEKYILYFVVYNFMTVGLFFKFIFREKIITARYNYEKIINSLRTAQDRHTVCLGRR